MGPTYPAIKLINMQIRTNFFGEHLKELVVLSKPMNKILQVTDHIFQFSTTLYNGFPAASEEQSKISKTYNLFSTGIININMFCIISQIAFEDQALIYLEGPNEKH
jgi:hypothetical protein